MRRRLALLVPHMRRAILIGKVIDLKTVRSQAFEETIDGLAAGVFLLDAHGKVAHANAAAHALLAEGDAARLAGGGLVVFDPEAERVLREAIAAAGEADSTAGAGGITLFGLSGVGYVAHVLPLASGARRAAGAPHAASAAVFLRRAIVDLAQAVGSLARHHGLTPAETRVLLAVAERGGVGQIAAGLGMSEATVKTHLQRIFKKTGTGRQVDLVKLAFGFAGSLAA
jgi:DNA-binding CsgD family transcriptional regulator